MIKFLFVVFFFLASSLFASEFQLKWKLAEAEPGSYLVLEQNKNFTFFHIHSKSADYVVLEEVSIPAAHFSRETMKWKEWFEKGAHGHTSWMMSQVNLKTGMFEETFSFSHKGWIDMSDSDTFFTTLLNLPFYEVPEAERKKAGTPGYNKVDMRPIWNPRLIVDGKALPDVSFSAFRTRWPSDGTELSRKLIEIYLPNAPEGSEITYPLYFPYWLEVEGKFGCARARVVDSGVEALSPKKNLPKRPPQLIGEAKRSELGLTFHLKSPPYYKEFMVLAEENSSFFGNSFPLPCETTLKKNGELSLFISQESLEVLREQGSSFYFVISPKDNPALTLRSSIISLKPNI